MRGDAMSKKEIVGEVFEIISKTALSLIPVGGPLITSVWDSLKSGVLQRRMDKWKSEIEERLSSLEMTLEEVGNNENFATALMKGTESALKTNDMSKLEYLANAVKNAAVTPIDESVLMIYMNWIDELTAWHIQILNYFRKPSKYSDANGYTMGSALEPLYKAFPEMSKKEILVEKIIDDMQVSGLLSKGSYIHAGMTPTGMMASRTTEIGNDFLDFII